jgi:hypothetical protein
MDEADDLENMLKEDIVPIAADGRLFRFAPHVVMTGFVGAFAVLPFTSALIVADLKVGVLYMRAVTALVVVGIVATSSPAQPPSPPPGGVTGGCGRCCSENDADRPPRGFDLCRHRVARIQRVAERLRKSSGAVGRLGARL